MAKKIVKVTDTPKSNLDLGKLASVVIENKDTIGKVADTLGDILGNDNKKTKSSKKSSNDNNILDTIGDLIGGSDTKTTTKKTSNDNNILDTIGDLIGGSDTKTTTKKAATKTTKSNSNDGLSKVLDAASEILKNK